MAAFDLAGKTVWVAGHRGMVGSALVRRLARERCRILTADREHVDLTRQDAVEDFVAGEVPDAIIVAAAKVGGIMANQSYPADFLYRNLAIGTNIVEAARRAGVQRLLFLGSSCIYPKHAPQPISEDALLAGPLEPSNEWYAVAKIAGIKLVQAYRRQYGLDYIAAMPTNLYGPGDNFDLATSHVLPALIRKVCDAKRSGADSITVWGTGAPRREFLHVDDCADALVHLLMTYSDGAPVNLGAGEDISILDLTRLVCEVADFRGSIAHDLSKPDGTPCKLLDGSKLRASGWRPSVGLRDGVAQVYRSYARMWQDECRERQLEPA